MEINELTSFIQPVSFTNAMGEPATPDSGTYRIDDQTGTAILAPTALPTPVSPVINLPITALQNRILERFKPL
jgi:hypothetical protein